MLPVALQNLDIVGIAIGVVVIYAAIWLFGSRAIDRYVAGRTFESQGRERVGLSPVLVDAKSREARTRRARFFHVTRHGRRAA